MRIWTEEGDMMSWVLSWSGSNPSPPPSKEFDREWRKVNWDQRNQIEEELRNFTIRHPELSHLRILLHGAVGAGKSSFINSVNSVFQHRVTTRAGAAAVPDGSHTIRYKSYRISDGRNNTLPFIFNDTMGLQDDRIPGFCSYDIVNAMLGHVRENYLFHPLCPLSDGDPSYISSPTLKDKVHCLVSVVQAHTISSMHEAVIRSIKDVGQKARDLDVPQVLILTHIDRCCPLVQENLRNVYISKKIKEKMYECGNVLGIPMTCIFPVQNYYEESDTNEDTDVLLLLALRQILSFANDYVEGL